MNRLNVSKQLENRIDKPPLDHFTTSDILINNLGTNIVLVQCHF